MPVSALDPEAILPLLFRHPRGAFLPFFPDRTRSLHCSGHSFLKVCGCTELVHVLDEVIFLAVTYQSFQSLQWAASIMSHLSLAGKNNVSPQGVLCVSLVHNELLILPEFLRHYRNLGITSFVMVDDSSTDGSREFLFSQDDVTVFTPIEGSTFSLHQPLWRKEVFDAFGSGRWCFTADIDEHFVYPDMEVKPLADLVDELDREGAKALLTVMIDMYADQPLREQNYWREDGRTLLQSFPYFDDFSVRMKNYWFGSAGPKFPTPPVSVRGGLPYRLLRKHDSKWESAKINAIRRCYWGVQNPINCYPRYRMPKKHPLLYNLLRLLPNSKPPRAPFISKLGLIKWQQGMLFPGGAHAVNVPVRCSERIAAFLHYYYAHSINRLHYMIKKNANYRNSSNFVNLVKIIGDSDKSPVCELSSRYMDSGSLKGIIR